MTQIGVFDYGVGNLRSVANALAHLGFDARVSSDPEELARCDRYILPGVGAFPYGMAALRDRGLDRLVLQLVANSRPLLGICLGMQMLGESSVEFCSTTGLDLVDGIVERLSPPAGSDVSRSWRLPNVGWAPVRPTGRSTGFAARLVERIPETASFYFVHSYALPSGVSTTVATSRYAGTEFAAVVGRGTIVGTQFHPEKSGPAGLSFLNDFCQLSPE